MAALNDAQKMFIIDRLACFRTPTEIAKEFEEVFETTVPLPTILYYDPSSVQGQKQLAQNWKDLFKARRDAFLGDVSAVPIASMVYRLQRLQQLADEPLVKKNPVQLRETLKQAAMEVGGMYLPRKEASENGGRLGGGQSTDADTRAAERHTELNSVLDTIRERRDQQDPAGGTDRPEPAA